MSIIKLSGGEFLNPESFWAFTPHYPAKPGDILLLESQGFSFEKGSRCPFWNASLFYGHLQKAANYLKTDQYRLLRPIIPFYHKAHPDKVTKMGSILSFIKTRKKVLFSRPNKCVILTPKIKVPGCLVKDLIGMKIGVNTVHGVWGVYDNTEYYGNQPDGFIRYAKSINGRLPLP